MAEDKDYVGNDDEKGGEPVTLVQTIIRIASIDSFTTSIAWTQENDVSASDILNDSREIVLIASFQKKNKSKSMVFLKPVPSKN